MDDPADNSNQRWRAALAPLGGPESQPPPDLEERIGRSLRVRKTGTRRLLLAFAAALLVIAGAAANRWWTHQSATGSTEPRFLLLLVEGPSFDSVSSSHEARVAEYSGWARDLARQGHLVDAAELAPVERILGDVPVRSGAEYLIDGMFIVTARDEAEAMAIAATCPHLRHGGGIRVRPMRS